jgi:hypothetical protein
MLTLAERQARIAAVMDAGDREISQSSEFRRQLKLARDEGRQSDFCKQPTVGLSKFLLSARKRKAQIGKRAGAAPQCTVRRAWAWEPASAQT